MRKQLDVTQLQLAQLLNVALSTVARWESWDPPKGTTLAKLALYAESKSLPAAATLKQLNTSDIYASLPCYVRAESAEELRYFRALKLIWRDPQFAYLRKKLDMLFALVHSD